MRSLIDSEVNEIIIISNFNIFKSRKNFFRSSQFLGEKKDMSRKDSRLSFFFFFFFFRFQLFFIDKYVYLLWKLQIIFQLFFIDNYVHLLWKLQKVTKIDTQDYR